MIIVTDAHVSKTENNHSAFFDMLKFFEGNHHDLIFLGDIFDLWVALADYESDVHHDFLNWCQEQKKYRSIGFVEGNHEFYLATERAQDFTWISSGTWYQKDSGILFVHGDQINRQDRLHLGFRKLLKSSIAKFLMRKLPFGPSFAESIKQHLKLTNSKFQLKLPLDEIKVFADSKFAEGVETIFMGHFHQEHIYSNRESKSLYILPDWFSSQKVTAFNQKSKETTFLHWKKIQDQL
jgi:UDP-2,3-diacylglucosamine pyrophosphatase LpxH